MSGKTHDLQLHGLAIELDGSDFLEATSAEPPGS